MVRVLAHGLKSLRFNSWSRTCTWVADQILAGVLQKTTNRSISLTLMFLSHVVFLSLLPPFLPLSLKINGKISSFIFVAFIFYFILFMYLFFYCSVVCFICITVTNCRLQFKCIFSYYTNLICFFYGETTHN